ncbi:MAG: diguanylate cyclase [Thiotrichales bacterium]|nr:diguanylate cyclase [Thiotrichales bacterium]
MQQKTETKLSAKSYLFALIGFIVLDALVLSHLFERQRTESFEAQSKLMSVTTQSVINGFANTAELIYDNVLNVPLYQQLLWEANHASEARKTEIRQDIFTRLEPLYNSMDKFKLKQLHFHLHSNESFLRFHRPNRYGDNLSEVRATVAYTNRTGFSVKGFEEGRIFNGYRFVFPLFWQGKPAGSVETSVSMKVIMDSLKRELNKGVGFIIRRDVVEEKVFRQELLNYENAPFSNAFLYEASLMHLQSRTLFSELLTQWQARTPIEASLKQNRVQTQLVRVNHQDYKVTLLPVKGALSTETAGFLVFYSLCREQGVAFWKYLLIFLITSLIAAYLLRLLYRSHQNERDLARSKKQLNQNMQRFTKAQQIAGLGTWEYDLRTQTLFWSDEVFRIFGEIPGTFTPSYERYLSYVHPEDRDPLDYAYRYSLAQLTPFQIKHRVFCNDGSMIYIQAECEHQLDQEGRPMLSLGTVLDITELTEREQRLESLGKRYQNLVERLPNLVYRFVWAPPEQRWQLEFVNHSVHNLSGYYPYELLNRNRCFLDLIHPQDVERVEQHIYSALEANQPYEIDYRLQRQDGSGLYVSDRGQKVQDEHGQWHVEGVMTDITAQRQALEKLQRFIDTQKNLVILTDGQVLAFANHAYYAFLGRTSSLPGNEQNPRCICDLFQPGEHFFDLSKLHLNDRHWIDALLRLPPGERNVAMKNAQGVLVTFSVEINHFDEKYYVVSFTDISEAFMEKLMWRHKASIDPLTGAYNRHFFEMSVASFMKLVLRNQQQVGLILMDIDHFKQLNDQYGHSVGDEVLCDVSALIRRNLRESDLLIRWGGEEFLIVLSVEHEDGLEKVAQSLQVAIANHPWEYGPVTASFGGTLIASVAEIDQAIQRADTGLYYVKTHGRNHYHFIPPSDQLLLG